MHSSISWGGPNCSSAGEAKSPPFRIFDSIPPWKPSPDISHLPPLKLSNGKLYIREQTSLDVPTTSYDRHNPKSSDQDRIILLFLIHLDDIPKLKILLRLKPQFSSESGKPSVLILPFVIRWSKSYVRKLRKRLRKILIYYSNRRCVLLTITIPAPPDSSEIADFDDLNYAIPAVKRAWRYLHDFLVRRHGHFSYLAVLEPTKRGYPHLHILLFLDRYVINQRELSKYLESHGAGKITDIRRIKGKDSVHGSLSYILKYLSKYPAMASEFVSRLPLLGIDPSDLSLYSSLSPDSPLLNNLPQDWLSFLDLDLQEKSFLVFSAYLWWTRIKTLTSSRDFWNPLKSLPAPPKLYKFWCVCNSDSVLPLLLSEGISRDQVLYLCDDPPPWDS